VKLETTKITKKIHSEGTKETKTNEEKMLPAVPHSSVKAGGWPEASPPFVSVHSVPSFVNFVTSRRTSKAVFAAGTPQ